MGKSEIFALFVCACWIIGVGVSFIGFTPYMEIISSVPMQVCAAVCLLVVPAVLCLKHYKPKDVALSIFGGVAFLAIIVGFVADYYFIALPIEALRLDGLTTVVVIIAVTGVNVWGILAAASTYLKVFDCQFWKLC